MTISWLCGENDLFGTVDFYENEKPQYCLTILAFRGVSGITRP